MSRRPDLFSPFEPGSGPLHRLPAPGKLTGAVAFVLVVALAPRGAFGLYAAAGGLLAVAAAVSRVSPMRLLVRLLWVEPFAIGIALLSLLQPDGVRIFLALLTKSTLCLVCFVLVATTTRFTDLLIGLRTLRVPALLVSILALTYRYLFLLVEEAGRMQRARLSRSGVRRRGLGWWLGTTVIAQLFIRSSERAERVHAAMSARGFGHERD
jgi:cobalt/nickel transport system permease protein